MHKHQPLTILRLQRFADNTEVKEIEFVIGLRKDSLSEMRNLEHQLFPLSSAKVT